MGMKEEDEWLVKIAVTEGRLKGDSEYKPQWGSSPQLVSLQLVSSPQQLVAPLR
jgi:hypothetical protein